MQALSYEILLRNYGQFRCLFGLDYLSLSFNSDWLSLMPQSTIFSIYNFLISLNPPNSFCSHFMFWFCYLTFKNIDKTTIYSVSIIPSIYLPIKNIAKIQLIKNKKKWKYLSFKNLMNKKRELCVVWFADLKYKPVDWDGCALVNSVGLFCCCGLLGSGSSCESSVM